eukprot:gnl/TRDRNA2_/TRDRNA2_96491_c0_seq1.p1 gnl/TRDRNA2_/TRDRNA2_96491_c0~~gnl/TRDRNA2_/TRDRNA2_96491_c0_seq1.p1  ORF type:complete len:440 (+),score=39.48 gnl/TRDRNA2_/TRDRNA2_96491_c0_seq1:3-1322(+)
MPIFLRCVRGLQGQPLSGLGRGNCYSRALQLLDLAVAWDNTDTSDAAEVTDKAPQRLLNALAVGVPTVAWIGYWGHRELLSRASCLPLARNFTELASAIEQLLLDPKRRRRCRDEGLQIAASLSPVKIAEVYMLAMRSLVLGRDVAHLKAGSQRLLASADPLTFPYRPDSGCSMPISPCSAEAPINQDILLTDDFQRLCGQAATVTDAESNTTTECSYKQEDGKLKIPCIFERGSRELVRRWIPSEASVLELGAGYGTASCEISAVTRNSGRHVAVEPDVRKWFPLMQNQAAHCCYFQILKEFVGSGKRPWSGRMASGVPFSKVEEKFKLRFDTLLADCDGCIESFVEENPGVLRNIKLLLFKADVGIFEKDICKKDKHRTDYNKLLARLQKDEGFKIVEHFKESEVPWPKNPNLARSHCLNVHYFALQRSTMPAASSS